MGWVWVAEPVERDKGHPMLKRPDGKVRAFGGVTSPYIGAVMADLPNHTLAIWFEDLGWQQVRFSVDIQDFDPFIHLVGGVPRLKVWLRHYLGDGISDATLTLLDTGYCWYD